MGLNQDLNSVTHEDFCQHILDVYYRAEREGTAALSKGWYSKARTDCETLANSTDLHVDLVIDVVAVLSPGMPWIWNVANAVRVINYQTSTAYPNNVRKARALLGGGDREEIVKGPKVTAFAENIRSSGTDDGVTLDTWAIRVAGGPTWYKRVIKQGPTAKQHRRLTQAYTEVADRLHLRPCELQAIVWHQIRIENGFDDVDWKVIDDYNPYS
jgi:hypothetical protein